MAGITKPKSNGMGTLHILKIDLAGMFYIPDKSLWLAILKRIVIAVYLQARIPSKRPKQGTLGHLCQLTLRPLGLLEGAG